MIIVVLTNIHVINLILYEQKCETDEYNQEKTITIIAITCCF